MTATVMRRKAQTPEQRARSEQRRRKRDERKLEELREKFDRAAKEHGESAVSTQWEREFLSEVPERIREYGSAYSNPILADPGAPGSALSLRQRRKARELAKLLRQRTREVDDSGEQTK